MLRTIIVLTIFVSFLPFSDGYTQEETPKAPYIQNNVCPFECCQYGKWTAKYPLKAYKREGDTTAIAFKIEKDEQFTAIRGNAHIVKLGIVVITESFNTYTKGDKVFVLSYKGEGVYDIWHKGNILHDIEGFWSNDTSVSRNTGVLKQSPIMVWWVLIQNKNGKQGWLGLRNISDNGFLINEKIDGMDACE